jgi:hypothetical protein
MWRRIAGPVTQSEVHIILLCAGGVFAMSLAFGQCASGADDDALRSNVMRDVVVRP